MWLGRELNPRHEDFQSSALPTELPSRSGKFEIRSASGGPKIDNVWEAGCSLCRILFVQQERSTAMNRRRSRAIRAPRSANAGKVPRNFSRAALLLTPHAEKHRQLAPARFSPLPGNPKSAPNPDLPAPSAGILGRFESPAPSSPLLDRGCPSAPGSKRG